MGKHAYNERCDCARCCKERDRRNTQADNQRALARGRANATARSRSRVRTTDLVERYRRMDDAGFLDRGEYDDVDW